MKHGWTIVSLVLSIILASSFACSDDDDDNDDNSADDVTDDDLDTDDDNDTVDDDQTEEELPFCEPYQEPVFWFNPYVFDNQYYEYMQECAGSHFLTGTVTVYGSWFSVQKGEYKLIGRWLTEQVPLPLVSGQTVHLKQSQSAGDDGCCDSSSLFIWDELDNLLLVYTVNETWRDFSYNGEEISAQTTWPQVCRYARGEGREEDPPVGTLERGLALSGHYQESTFYVAVPGGSTLSDDGRFYVHWPVGYWHEGQGYEDWGIHTILELVVVNE
ncbi:MAG TPA: hypothetical protein PK961_01310 [bacterium]|nr:hypothetical protein [bacterium]